MFDQTAMAGLSFLSILTCTIIAVTAFDPYQKNIFQQTTSEVQNAPLTDVTGSVPEWLSGDFVRQNCASFGDIDGAQFDYVSHLFDCIGMTGRYKFENGKVHYSNKRYDSRDNRIWKHYNYNMSQAKVSWMTIFSDIDPVAYQRSKNINYNETLSVSPTVNYWRSRAEDPILAVTESIWTPTELRTRPDLDITGLYYSKFMNRKFPGYFSPVAPDHAFIDNPAHEQTDPDGTIWSSTMDIERYTASKMSDLEAAVMVYKIKGQNRTLVTRYVLGKYSVNETDCSNLTQEEKDVMPGYTHYIQTTDSYILVPQTSYRFDYCQDYENRNKLMAGFIRSYKWHPDVNSSILVFDRKNMTEVHHVYLPYAKFFTHDINAYEDSTHIYLDTLAYNNADAYLRVPLLKEVLSNFNWSTSFIRIAINKLTWSYDEALSGPLTSNDPFGRAEFPSINYEFSHQNDYTFTYFIANALYQDSKVAKLDVKNKHVVYWTPPIGYYPQEPIFVPSPSPNGEDDGIILCSGPVSNPAGTSFLAILNASDISQIALIKNPNAALFGLHNRFYKQSPGIRTTLEPKVTTKGQGGAGKRAISASIIVLLQLITVGLVLVGA